MKTVAQKQTCVIWCRRREEQSVKLRKTAEKLLMNQLKKHALKNMSGSQQAAVLAQAKQASAAGPSPSDEIPADLLVITCANTSHKLIGLTKAQSSFPNTVF